MNARFLEGEHVYMRALRRDDLAGPYLDWLNDPEVTRYMETGVFPTRLEDLERFYQDAVPSKYGVLLAICDRSTDRHIGNISLNHIHWIHRTAWMGIMIGEREFWNRGVGSEAVRLIVDYGFRRLNLHKINLGVTAEHAAAVHAYEKVGFVIEGRAREEGFVDGRRVDKLYMGLLRDAFK